MSRINYLKKLVSEIKNISSENMSIDLSKKSSEDMSKKLSELFGLIEDIDVYTIRYYKRAINLEEGNSFNELEGQGIFQGFGVKYHETSALIKIEDGRIINYELNKIKFID